MAGGLITVALTGGITASTQASELVQDGSFENAQTNFVLAPGFFGDGWNVTTGEAAVYFYLPNVAHTGTQSLDLNESTGLNTITQTLATVPGTEYTISFYAGSTDGPSTPDSLAVYFGSELLRSGDFSGTGLGVYNQYLYRATAVSNSTDLTFASKYGSAQGTNGAFLDDVSVTAPDAVPEASTTVSLGLLLTLGLAGFVAARRKKPA